MDQPKIPTLKDAQKPQVKIRGLGAGLTLFDRLKQFKKKDLAFILAGMGTLFMAPLAEHFMMAPEGGDAAMSPGWGGGRGGSNLFGGGGSPYESGNNSIAQGGAIGGAGDIITPLNVRDPSALVMGPGQAQQPPAGSAAPSVTPSGSGAGRSDADLKDALAGSAARGMSAAAKRAPLPIPKVALGGSGLRGLGVAGGGSSASGSLGPVSGGGSGGRAGAGEGGLNLVRSAPNFRGAAGPRGSSNLTGLDGTKRAGQNAGDAFSRSGNALNGLNEAAKEQIPGGGSGFSGSGQGGSGANDKASGGNNVAGNKTAGESLEFLKRKREQDNKLELEFERAKAWDQSIIWGGILGDFSKTMVSKGFAEPLASWLGGFWAYKLGGADKGRWLCTSNGSDHKRFSRPASLPTSASDGEWVIKTTGVMYQGKGGPAVAECMFEEGDEKPASANPETEAGMTALTAGVGDTCKKVSADNASAKTGAQNEYKPFTDGLLEAAKRVETGRNLLIGGGTECGSPAPKTDTASKMLTEAKAKIAGAAPAVATAKEKDPVKADAVQSILDATDKDEPDLAKAPAQALIDAKKLIADARKQIEAGKAALGAKQDPPKKAGDAKDAFNDVTKAYANYELGYKKAQDAAKSLQDSAEALDKAAGALEPVVKGAEPKGTLPDILALNKAAAELKRLAEAEPLLKASIADKQVPAVVGATATGEAKELAPSLTKMQQALAALQKALGSNDLAIADGDIEKDAQLGPRREEARKAVVDAKLAVSDAQTKAQAAQKNFVGTIGTGARGVTIQAPAAS